MPYGTGWAPYDGPKSGCSFDVGDMCDSHALLRTWTGSLETSACHQLSAGKTVQGVLGSAFSAASAGSAATASGASTARAASTARGRLTRVISARRRVTLQSG